MSSKLNSGSLKMRFLAAVINGDLGVIDDTGHVVTLKQFKAYFSDIKTDYINSFLPAATIEQGFLTATHTKYIFRIKNGVYRVHDEAIGLYLKQVSSDDNINFIKQTNEFYS